MVTDSFQNTGKIIFVVTFDTNCNNAVTTPEPQIIKKGEYAVTPSLSSRTGYQFAGWFVNKEELDWTNVFAFGSTPITQDITLFAIWVDIDTDSDGDGLADALENYCGTNINIPDTDSDGLTDYEEVVLVGTNPLKQDSDNNGITDFDEDNDGDRLNNGFEVSIKTNANNVDTDNDGLTDDDELNQYSTEPTNSDTDADGAFDGWEIENGFDPCVYNDRFNVTIATPTPTETQPVTAGVSAELNGTAASSLSVNPIGASTNPLLSSTIPGYLGSAYNFEVDGEFNSAILSFSFDSSLGTLGADFQPRIYYFNETDGTFEELENQTVSSGVIGKAMDISGTKEEFIENMIRQGYGVEWSDTRMHIVYTCYCESKNKDGKHKKSRDNKLHSEKYLKCKMEEEFYVREQLLRTTESRGTLEAEREKEVPHTADTSRNNAANDPFIRKAVGADEHDDGRYLGRESDSERGDFESAEYDFRNCTDRNGKSTLRTAQGNRANDTEAYESSGSTGWESSRESWTAYRMARNYGQFSVGAESYRNGTAHRSGLGIGSLYGLASAVSIMDDDTEDAEEKRRRIEAEQSASNVGAVIGTAIGLAMSLSGEEEDTEEDKYDEKFDDGFEQTM